MIRIAVFNAYPKKRVRQRETMCLARHVLKGEGIHNVACNIIFIGDKQMIDLNGKFLNHWYSTDVLSFSLEQNDMHRVEGEVYVNLDQAQRQADEYSVSFKNEISRLVIHGLLHLVGYDDSTKREKQRMTKLENGYLESIK